jgi:uncharacterized UPF0160 family protein
MAKIFDKLPENTSQIGASTFYDSEAYAVYLEGSKKELKAMNKRLLIETNPVDKFEIQREVERITEILDNRGTIYLEKLREIDNGLAERLESSLHELRLEEKRLILRGEEKTNEDEQYLRGLKTIIDKISKDQKNIQRYWENALKPKTPKNNNN